MQAEKNINDDTYFRINGCFQDIVGKMMKQHQLQIQSIIENTTESPLKNSRKSVVNVEHDAPESNVKKITDNEHSNQQVSNQTDQLEHLSSAITDDDSLTISQVYANEQSELKYLLIKDELSKRQNILEEVLLINEALQIKIKEYEVDSLKLPMVKIPTAVTHTTVQTDHSNGLVCPKSEIVESVDGKEIAESLSVVSSIKSSQHDSVKLLRETISKLKVDERKRTKQVEKLVLKNFTLKLEICELKKEIKKYSSVWANDRYFNSLFLDATKQSIAK